jgi:hypothetical protein
MAKGVKRRGKRRRRGAKGAGGSAGGDGLRGALSGLQSYMNRLCADRDRLDQQIAALRGALGSLGAPTRAPAGRAGGGGRRPREGSLKEFITRVLSKNGGAMAVKDVTAAVVKAGYETRNRTLGKSVGIALAQMPNVAKLGRGTFKLK